MKNKEFIASIQRDAENIYSTINVLINATRFDLDTAKDEKLVAEYKSSVKKKLVSMLTENTIKM